MQMVRWFLERAWLQKGLGLQTHRALGEKGRQKHGALRVFRVECSSLSRARTLCHDHLAIFVLLFLPVVSLPVLTFSQLSLSWVHYLFLVCRETSLLSSDGWMSSGLKPSSGTKLEFALSSLLRWELFFFTTFLGSWSAGCGLLRVIKFDTCCFALWWCRSFNELNRRRRRWMSLIPGHCQGNTFVFIQIFDSALNVTLALPSAEAEI